MTAHARKLALLAAREEFGIDDTLHALDGISVALQKRFGFEEIPLESIGLDVLKKDPGIDSAWAERLLTLVDRTQLDQLLPQEDKERREQLLPHVAQTPLGPQKKWYGAKENPLAYAERLRTEHETFRRISVVLETDPTETVGVGNFQVFGSGQKIREFLWALSGIMPKDQGQPINEHFRRYLELSDEGFAI